MTARASRWRAAAALLGALAACGEPPDERIVPVSGPPPVLRPVVRPALRALDAELAAEDAASAPPADREHVRGLVTLVRDGERDLAAIAAEEVAALGDGSLIVLEPLVRDPAADPGERGAALQLLAALDSPASAALLLELAEAAQESWMRASATWRLGETSQDWVVPPLLLRLKYEEDHDTVVWIAKTLAHFGNFAGLDALAVVQAESRREDVRASAAARLAEIADAAGFADARTLWTAWTSGAQEPVFRPERSPRFRREVWRRVAGFDAFQLRGVDDGRFVLERLGPPTAALVAEALRDESLYVRVNTAQSLERMGPRAAAAGPALVEALDDPDLAPNAAAALGAIAFPPGEAALVERLSAERTPALRLAAARAVAGYGRRADAATAAALRGLLSSEVEELRQAAAESLVHLGHGAEVAELLLPYLTSDRVEPTTTARALRAWLEAEAAGGNEPARRALDEWDARVIPSDRIVPPEERERSRAERRAVLEEHLPAILEAAS